MVTDGAVATEGFTLVGSVIKSDSQGAWPNFSPSNLPSAHASEAPSRQPSVVPASELSAMAQALAEGVLAADVRGSDASDDGDALAFEHVESFNMLCVGESGLGKSTFLRDVCAAVSNP